MDFIQYIGENTLMCMAVLWVLGTFLKGSEKVPDWLIPFILVGCGIGICICIVGLNVNAIMQGVLCAGGAVLVNQCGKQLGKRDSGDKE